MTMRRLNCDSPLWMLRVTTRSFSVTCASFARMSQVELETPLEEIGVVEMAPADERGGMAAPLAHGAGRHDSHRPEEEPFGALGAGDQAVGPEGAAPAAVQALHRAQLVVGMEGVAHHAVGAAHQRDALDVVRSRSDAHHRALALGEAR